MKDKIYTARIMSRIKKPVANFPQIIKLVLDILREHDKEIKNIKKKM